MILLIFQTEIPRSLVIVISPDPPGSPLLPPGRLHGQSLEVPRPVRGAQRSNTVLSDTVGND